MFLADLVESSPLPFEFTGLLHVNVAHKKLNLLSLGPWFTRSIVFPSLSIWWVCLNWFVLVSWCCSSLNGNLPEIRTCTYPPGVKFQHFAVMRNPKNLVQHTGFISWGLGNVPQTGIISSCTAIPARSLNSPQHPFPQFAMWLTPMCSCVQCAHFHLHFAGGNGFGGMGLACNCCACSQWWHDFWYPFAWDKGFFPYYLSSQGRLSHLPRSNCANSHVSSA